MRNRKSLLAIVALAASLALPTTALAQETCPDGAEPRGWIGVYAFHCPGGACLYEKVLRDDVVAMYEFSSEPRMRAIDSGGPAAGILEEGDVLVAVNGYLITGARGGRELANLPTGQTARLTVRRGDRLEEVSIVTEGKCEPAMVIVGNTRLTLPTLPALAPLPLDPLPGIPSVGYAVAPEASMPPSSGGYALSAPPAPSAFGVSAGPGSMGMAFSCDGCAFTFGQDDYFAWNAPQFLEVEAVTEGGTAAAAGLKPGDVLTHVGGHTLESDEGGRLLFRADAGDELEIRYQRDGQERETVMTVGGESLTRIGGVGLYSEDSSWGSVVGRLAGGVGLAAAPPVPDAPMLASGSSLMVSGETWGPTALGAVFEWCDQCTWIVQNGVTRWEMTEYPAVAEITPGGAADRAGLAPGDVITHIDGLDMKTDEAADRFLNPRDGDRLRIRYRRADEERETVLVAIVEPPR